jgi:hypothetical protein
MPLAVMVNGYSPFWWALRRYLLISTGAPAPLAVHVLRRTITMSQT